MKKRLVKGFARLKNWVGDLLKEEDGSPEIVATILIIIAVIAVAAIFRNELSTIVNDLMTKIKTDLGLGG